MKPGGGEVVLSELRALTPSGVPPSVVGPVGEAIGYFENQKHRMDSPAYQAKGRHIGSGP